MPFLHQLSGLWRRGFWLGLDADEIIELVKRSIVLSYRDDESKKEMLTSFERQTARAKKALLNPG